MEFQYEVKIPKERIAVLVGTKGVVRKEIEKMLDIKVKINSEEGDVVLSGEDSISLHSAQSIIKAIGRGFNPETALSLIGQNTIFEIIDISDYCGESKKRLEQVRSRVIGTGGKARKYIEELTNTNIVIYGKTIGIIGGYEGVKLARRAFESLLNGSRHSTVYAFLEKEAKKSKQVF